MFFRRVRIEAAFLPGTLVSSSEVRSITSTLYGGFALTRRDRSRVDVVVRWAGMLVLESRVVS